MVKLNIITVHLCSKWMKVQKRFIDKHLTNCEIKWHVVVSNENDSLISKEIYKTTPIIIEPTYDIKEVSKRHGKKIGRDHSIKLATAYKQISETMKDDDLILVMDSDAFPIKNIDHLIESINKEDEYLYAIQRKENGELYAHPSFCLTKKKTISRLSKHVNFVNEGSGETPVTSVWMRAIVQSVWDSEKIDTAGALTQCIEREKLKWVPLERTNTIDLVPVLFGIYGDLIYHHGCGSRHPSTDVIRKRINLALTSEELITLIHIYNKISTMVFDTIVADDNFCELFEGETPVHLMKIKYTLFA